MSLLPQAVDRAFGTTNSKATESKINVTADQHERFELFILGDNEKKVTVEPETRAYPTPRN